ncbi:MAG: dTDP-4-dehydrorhamnose reductase [Parasphingorhabdus sp.]|jgi:dTDP-4-dehydrorhamnose reductase
MVPVRLLITGVNGQVGGYLANLEWPNFEVTVVSRDELDLSRPDEVRSKILQSKPQVIINAAAYTAVDKAESEPALAQTINAASPGVMAQCLKQWNGLLVHYSTDYVFSGDAEHPYAEGDPVAPTGVYGRTKLNGEIAIRESGVDHIILRTSWVYAHRGSNFFLTMLRLAAERDELTIVSDQQGTPTFALDLAELTQQMVMQQSPARDLSRLGTYHLGNGGETNWHQFAADIIRGAGDNDTHVLPIPTSAFPTAASRPAYSVLDKTKASEGYSLKIPSWQEGLARCISLYQHSR